MNLSSEDIEQLAQILVTAQLNAAEPVDYSIPTTLTEVRAQLEQHHNELFVLEQDIESLRIIIASLSKARSEKFTERDDRKIHIAKLQREAQRLELERAKDEYAKSLEPDLTNPELLRLIHLLEVSFPRYNDMDDYQVQDVVFMLDRWLRTKDQTNSLDNVFTRGIINANDTGMGKTLETAAFLTVMRANNPNTTVLWLTKASLAGSSARECFNKWGFPLVPITGLTNDKVQVIRGMAGLPFPMGLTINYEAMTTKAVAAELASHKWDFIVIDEVHKLRGGANATPTNVWVRTKDFIHSQQHGFPIMLSGSIINNEPAELFAYLHIMDPIKFPERDNLVNLFKSGILDAAEITKILAPSMFRRRKDEVSIKMPERIEQVHELTLPAGSLIEKVYNDFTEQMWTEIEETGEVLSTKNVLHKLHLQRSILVGPGHFYYNKPRLDEFLEPVLDPATRKPVVDRIRVELGEPFKLDYAVELANELIMEGQQVVICSSGYVAPLKYIQSKLIASSELLDGEHSSEGSDMEHRFQQGETRVILTNLATGAEGFNFHQDPTAWPGGASHMIMIDDWYNPERVKQMMDRVWRRGSVNRVIIHRLQVSETVDMVVQDIRESKSEVNAKIMESKSLRGNDNLKDILAKHLKRKATK